MPYKIHSTFSMNFSAFILYSYVKPLVINKVLKIQKKKSKQNKTSCKLFVHCIVNEPELIVKKNVLQCFPVA